MLSKNGQEAIAMSRFNQANHFVHDYIFEQVLRLCHKLSIEADVTCLMIAASPLCLHPLKKIPSNANNILMDGYELLCIRSWNSLLRQTFDDPADSVT